MVSNNPRRSAMLVLSYIAFLGFIPLMAEKSDREVRWHAKNGLLLFGVVVLIAVLATAIGILVPLLSCLYGIVMFFVSVIYAVIAILAVVKALQGQRLIVPGVSKYAERIG